MLLDVFCTILKHEDDCHVMVCCYQHSTGIILRQGIRDVISFHTCTSVVVAAV